MAKKPPGIYGFTGEYRFLSNFWMVQVPMDKEFYPSVEHAYQAAKTLDLEARKPFQSPRMSCQAAKAAGQKLKLRCDWENIKYDVMLELVRYKFIWYAALAGGLLETGAMYLEETNAWGDTYWGVCKGLGQNRLGKILMKVRGELNARRNGSKGP